MSRCEDITSDRDQFSDFFETICQGRLRADDAFLDAVMALPKIDQRVLKPTSPRTEFLSWQPWQQDLLIFLLNHFGLVDLYGQKLGYDLSFLRLTGKGSRRKSKGY